MWYLRFLWSYYIKKKKRERRQAGRNQMRQKNGKMLITVYLSKLGIKKMGIHCPNIFFIFCIDTELWNIVKFLNLAYECVVYMWLYIFIRYVGKYKEKWTRDPWPQGIVGSLNTGHQKVCLCTVFHQRQEGS